MTRFLASLFGGRSPHFTSIVPSGTSSSWCCWESSGGERGYRPSQSECLATERKSQKGTLPKVMGGVIKDEAEVPLRIKHSPDKISKPLAFSNLKISHETIYQHITDDRKAGGDLALNLRINGRLRYRRRSKIGRGEKIPNRLDIEERPTVVSRRKRYGNWEADLIQGGFVTTLRESQGHGLGDGIADFRGLFRQLSSDQ